MFELMLAAATVLAPGVRRQTFEYAVPDKTPIVISGWSRATDAHFMYYCIGCDIWFDDGTLEWRLRQDFSQGTHDWEKATAIWRPKKPVKKILFYFSAQGGTGSAEWRDLMLERREPGPDEAFRMARRTLRPFEDADEINETLCDQWSHFICRRRKEQGSIESGNPLQVDEVRVWTADPLRRVTPLTFPGAADCARAIDLDLAQGETECFQILVSTGRAAESKGLKLDLADLKDSSGRPFRGTFGWRRQGYLKRAVFFKFTPFSAPAQESWLPDPLLPAAAFDVPKGGTIGTWLEVKAARDAAHGIYQGTVRVRESGAKARVLAEIPVSVRVRDFALPERFGVNTIYTMLEGFYRVAYGERDAARFMRMAQDVMLDHRLNPTDESRHAPPKLEDLIYAFERGASLAVLLNLVPKPKDPNTIWVCYSPVEELQKPSFYEYVRETLMPIWTELKARGYADRAIVYGFDERNREFYPTIDALWKRLRQDFPGLPLRTSAKMYKDYVLGARDELCFTTDWFGPRIDVWRDDVTAVYHARGKKVGMYCSEDPLYPYPCIGSYEFPLADARILPWMAELKGADSLSYWAVNYWNYGRGTQLDESKTCFPEWNCYNPSSMPGDGVLIYPGKRSVLPSLRLAALRDGVEDAERLQILKTRCGKDAADAFASELVRSMTDFDRDYGKIEAVRRRIADRIERTALPKKEDLP